MNVVIVNTRYPLRSVHRHGSHSNLDSTAAYSPLCHSLTKGKSTRSPCSFSIFYDHLFSCITKKKQALRLTMNADRNLKTQHIQCLYFSLAPTNLDVGNPAGVMDPMHRRQTAEDIFKHFQHQGAMIPDSCTATTDCSADEPKYVRNVAS